MRQILIFALFFTFGLQCLSVWASDSIPKRKVLVSCYQSGGDRESITRCARIKAMLRSPACQPPVELMEVPDDATPGEIKTILANRPLPRGSLVITTSHGIIQSPEGKNDRFLEDRIRRPEEHHLTTGGHTDLFDKKGEKGLGFPKGVRSVELLKTYEEVTPGLSHWLLSCHSGKVCESNEMKCVGATCQALDDTVASNTADYVDTSTIDLIELYCDKKKFDEVDALKKSDGEISGEELHDYFCKKHPPFISFRVLIGKEGAKGLAFEKELEKYKKLMNLAFSPEKQKRLSGLMKRSEIVDGLIEQVENGQQLSLEQKKLAKENLLSDEEGRELELGKELLKLGVAEEMIAKPEIGGFAQTEGIRKLKALYPGHSNLAEQMTWEVVPAVPRWVDAGGPVKVKGAYSQNAVSVKAYLPKPKEGCIYEPLADAGGSIGPYGAHSYEPNVSKFSLKFFPDQAPPESIPRTKTSEGLTAPAAKPAEIKTHAN